MPPIPARPDDGTHDRAPTEVPAGHDGALVTAWTWVTGRNGARAKSRKEPWETVLGGIAQLSLRNAAFGLIPAVLFVSAVSSRAYIAPPVMFSLTVVLGLFVAFAALRIGWCIGTDQGMLDKALVDDCRAQRQEAEFRLRAARRLGFRLPRQPRGEGYLYVIEFSTGSIKVGLTEDPKRRLGQHLGESRAFGVHIANYWISPAHIDFRSNETRLINRCGKVSRERSRKEYFHDVPYATAVEFASGLAYHSKSADQTSVEGVWA